MIRFLVMITIAFLWLFAEAFHIKSSNALVGSTNYYNNMKLNRIKHPISAWKTTITSTTETSTTTTTKRTDVCLGMASRRGGGGYDRRGSDRGYGDRGGRGERSQRQERVGQLVLAELGQIIHRGQLRYGRNMDDGKFDFLDDELRRRISIVDVNVSPDLRQARVSVSIRTPKKKQPLQVVQTQDLYNEEVDDDDDVSISSWMSGSMDVDGMMNPAVEKRQAYSWLVRNTKSIRHSLAKRMSHLKACPDLTFVQVDISAATDVMYLIDKVSSGYKRESIYDNEDGYKVPTGVMGGMDFDEVFEDDDDWDDDEDDDQEDDDDDDVAWVLDDDTNDDSRLNDIYSLLDNAADDDDDPVSNNNKQNKNGKKK